MDFHPIYEPQGALERTEPVRHVPSTLYFLKRHYYFDNLCPEPCAITSAINPAQLWISSWELTKCSAFYRP